MVDRKSFAEIGLATALFIVGCGPATKPEARSANERSRLATPISQTVTPEPKPAVVYIPEKVKTPFIPNQYHDFFPVPITDRLATRIMAVPQTNILITQLNGFPGIDSFVSKQGLQELYQKGGLQRFDMVNITLESDLAAHANYAHLIEDKCVANIRLAFVAAVPEIVDSTSLADQNSQAAQLLSERNHGILWKIAKSLELNTNEKCKTVTNPVHEDFLDHIQKIEAKNHRQIIWHTIDSTVRMQDFGPRRRKIV